MALVQSFYVSLLVVFVSTANSAFATDVKQNEAKRSKMHLPAQRIIKIGSRDFPESVLVAEILSSAIEKYTDLQVDRKFHLGGVKVCLSAMTNDKLDVYPDYTGSLIHNVIGDYDVDKYLFDYLSETLRNRYNFALSRPLGFDNSFVLAVRRDFAEKYKLKTLSDLGNLLNANKALESSLRAAFKHSFIKRSDGYAVLQKIYGFDFKNLLLMEYNIALQNLVAGRVDIIDAFSTDSRLKNPQIVTLTDDRQALLPYASVFVIRERFLQNENLDYEAKQKLKKVFNLLADSLTNEKIIELNARIETGETYKSVAVDFLNKLYINSNKLHVIANEVKQSRIQQDLPILMRALYQHVNLSICATILASVLGVVIGTLISYHQRTAQIVLAVISIVQTIPSLALLALLIPICGLGFFPSLTALFIYALLPIIQNTFAGITAIEPKYIDLAKSLALRELSILTKIKLPMAFGHIVGGIRTSAVICIGTATLATFVGGGGLGDLIKAGIDLNSNYMISLGAIPAALLALLASLALSQLERNFSMGR